MIVTRSLCSTNYMPAPMYSSPCLVRRIDKWSRAYDTQYTACGMDRVVGNNYMYTYMYLSPIPIKAGSL